MCLCMCACVCVLVYLNLLAQCVFLTGPGRFELDGGSHE